MCTQWLDAVKDYITWQSGKTSFNYVEAHWLLGMYYNQNMKTPEIQPTQTTMADGCQRGWYSQLRVRFFSNKLIAPPVFLDYHISTEMEEKF